MSGCDSRDSGFESGRVVDHGLRASVFVEALAAWDWVDPRRQDPVLTSLFGDIFSAAPDGFWFLSTVDGTLTRPWADRDALVAALDTPEGQDEWLLGELAMSAERQGVRLAEPQVYVFAPHPVLTGNFDVENVRAMDLPIAMSVIAQSLAQSR